MTDGATRRRSSRRTTTVALVAAAAALLLVADGAAAAEIETPFTDDDWSVHETGINAIAEQGITVGCNPPENDRYCPNETLTRGQMAAFLVRAVGFESADGSDTFSDDDGSIFEGDIEKLAAAGVVKGCNPPADDRYCPNEPLTRAQMASLLGRALDLSPGDGDAFVDIAGSVHAGYIDAIAAEGITFGCNPPTNDRYCPRNPVTRAQMASFLTRALGLDPVYNEIALLPDSACSSDRTVCTATISLPVGSGFDITEGWKHVKPFVGSEESSFRAPGTDFTATLDGAGLVSSRHDTDLPSQATREWRAEIRNLGPGTHFLRGTWRWDGLTNLVVVLTIVVP